jgi:cell division protein FtsA
MICALDVGTTKVCALIGTLDENNKLRVTGMGRAPSKGLRRGVVVNTVDATAAIGLAIQQAEAAAGGVTMDTAYVGIAGAHVAAIGSKSVVAVGRNGRKITSEDTQRALEQARNIALPHNREIINAVARTYTVDDQQGILNPVGMFGYRLEVDASIITGAASAITNLINCVHDNGLEIEDLVLQPLASAEAVLTDEERQAGVALVDIGGGTTDLAIYLESAPYHTYVLDIGGDHFVRDVAAGLRMPYDKAEALIKQFGHALPEQVPADGEVRARRFGEDGQQTINRRLLAEIINARAEEVIDLVIREVKRSGYDGLLPAGVVLTGGVAQLAGLTELSRNQLTWPVRVGRPNGLGASVADLSSPEYATAVGLLLWGLRRGTQPRVALPPSGPWWGPVVKFFRRLLPVQTA